MKCIEPNCERKSKAKGLCLKHYKQVYYNRGETDKLYDIWRQMTLRCYDATNVSYHNYGARGIRVCSRWLVGALNVKPHKVFRLDMGERPSTDYSLERKNNNGHYEPDNCKWATKQEQCRNTRTNLLITFNGETKCLSEWAETLGIPRTRITDRLKLGWTLEDAIALPKQLRKR